MSIFSAAAIAVISNSKHGIAVNANGAVTNGNAYYFAWANFVTSVMLFVSYLRSAFRLDVTGEIGGRSARLNLWAALLATSIVVMASSANIFADSCVAKDHTGSNRFCVRTMYGVALGRYESYVTDFFLPIYLGTDDRCNGFVSLPK